MGSFGSWLKKRLTPPKSIRKFQFKKLGKLDWWKDFAGEVALPAAAIATGAGALGVGGLGALGGAASAAGGGSKLGTALKYGGAALGALEGASQAKQSRKDSKKARRMANEAADLYRQINQQAQDRYNATGPLREMFMQGMTGGGMIDTSNPFSRNPWAPQPMMTNQGGGPGATMGGPGVMGTDPTGGGQVMPPPGAPGGFAGGLSKMASMMGGGGGPPGGFAGGLANMASMMGGDGSPLGGRSGGSPVNRAATQKGSGGGVDQKRDKRGDEEREN